MRIPCPWNDWEDDPLTPEVDDPEGVYLEEVDEAYLAWKDEKGTQDNK